MPYTGWGGRNSPEFPAKKQPKIYAASLEGCCATNQPTPGTYDLPATFPKGSHSVCMHAEGVEGLKALKPTKGLLVSGNAVRDGIHKDKVKGIIATPKRARGYSTWMLVIITLTTCLAVVR